MSGDDLFGIGAVNWVEATSMIHLNFQNLELAFSEGRAPALSSRANVGRVVQIGSEDEDQEETLVLVTRPGVSLTPFLAVRCLYSQWEVAPRFLIHRSSGVLFVGLDQTVAGVLLLDDAGTSFTKHLSGRFTGFIEVESTGDVVCLHELGVVCLSAVGEVRWEWESDDLITGVSMEGNQLIVSVDDHSTQTLDLIPA